METQTMTFHDQSSVGVPSDVYTLDNYEVAVVESSASPIKPSITIKQYQVYVNAELLKCVPDMIYVQFLINRTSKRLILRPCDKNEQDFVRLRTLSEVSAKPRHIHSTEFCPRLFEFMQWDVKFRYKLTGMPVIINGVKSFAFDLNAFTKYELPIKTEPSAQKKYESHLRSGSGFGATVGEQLENPIITHFSDDTAIEMEVSDNDNHC